MDIPDSFVNLTIGMVGGIVGGIVTGYYTLKATDKAIREENIKELRRDEKEIQNLLEALGVEIKTLWEFHMRRVGNLIEGLADGQPLEFYYPLTQDYFTIYDRNAGLIGRINDCDLSEAIVVCYNKCKKVVDGFKYNNELLKEYRGIRDEPYPKDCVQYKDMITYATVIKEDHFELKGYVEKMLHLLENRT